MARFDSLTDWLAWQETLHPQAIDLGLRRATGVFNQLNPSAIKPPTVVVAGTNGKGSSIAFLESIYRAQGYRVGSYTSPHILKYNERIKINGEMVNDDTICQAFSRIEAVRNQVSLSYFEFGTLAALDIFWRAELDVQLLEVGLGGRLDAVNIIDSDVALITSICIDHIDWLGETRELIAREKAGVFRPFKPAIVGDLEPPDSLKQCANNSQTPLLRINQDFSFQVNQDHWHWFCQGKKKRDYPMLPLPSLKGEHQYRNAASALMVITQMEDLLPVDERAIHLGLQTVQLAGRSQLLSGKVPVLLDVAHNPQAVKVLLNYLQQHFSDKKIYAMFSMMKDKDIETVINIIKPVIDYWFITPIDNTRAASQSFLLDCFEHCQVKQVASGFTDFPSTFHAVKKKARAGDLILIFGSFFLVSEYLAQLSDSVDKGGNDG